ncbi:MAG: 4Fe-4S binding protein [Candidatus Bathyarchaeia archaeon]|jgi:NAD-dependent dihydropyrimidine dehydrogenase PreA subunit
MASDLYEQLADALNRLPNGFPRTDSGVEIRILKLIFSPEEASLACQLGGESQPVDAIAKRVGLATEEAEAKLSNMAGKGMVFPSEKDGKRAFSLAPFIVGILENTLERNIPSRTFPDRLSPTDHIDAHQLIHLVEEYLANGGAAGIMKPQPALHRVVPAQKAIKSEWILPYDDVAEILRSAKSFGLGECICRLQREHVGERKCDFPLKVCLFFSPLEGQRCMPGTAEATKTLDTISKEEALEVLDKAEQIGLVHTVSNVMRGVGYVCNCCGCCCEILRGITDFGIKNSVAQANYFSVIDPDKCNECGICIERCQVHAISNESGVMVVDRDRCIGCGLCVTGCPTKVARLERKPEAEMVHPPADFEEWGHERLLNRR